MVKKPWLSQFPTKKIPLDKLQQMFTLTDTANLSHLQADERVEYNAEIEFIRLKVVPKWHQMREKKSDMELLHDARFFNKNGQFLL